MGSIPDAGNHLVISMEHDHTSDCRGVGSVAFGPQEAEQRYMAWRTVSALESIAASLETVVLACLFAYGLYVLAELAARFFSKGEQP